MWVGEKIGITLVENETCKEQRIFYQMLYVYFAPCWGILVTSLDVLEWRLRITSYHTSIGDERYDSLHGIDGIYSKLFGKLLSIS